MTVICGGVEYPNHEQPTLPLGPRVRIPPHAQGKPVIILWLCREAAMKADWSLRRWTEFRVTAMACLTAAATTEETELFMRVVAERFHVS